VKSRALDTESSDTPGPRVPPDVMNSARFEGNPGGHCK
jgi:hypothetical protein